MEYDDEEEDYGRAFGQDEDQGTAPQQEYGVTGGKCQNFTSSSRHAPPTLGL